MEMKKLLILILICFPLMGFANFDVSLKFGSKGESVFELQEFLQDQNFYTGKIDGKFGFGTLRAVKAFQAKEGLKIDGYFGRVSREKANIILADLLKDSNDTEIIETGTIAPIPVIVQAP